MNPRIEKLKAERDSIAEKVEKLTARLKALDEQIIKLENTDIVGIVRENGLSIDQLAALMALLDRIEVSIIDFSIVYVGITTLCFRQFRSCVFDSSRIVILTIQELSFWERGNKVFHVDQIGLSETLTFTLNQSGAVKLVQ